MEETRTLHWLPCSIGYTGVAKVGAYFMPAPTGGTFTTESIANCDGIHWNNIQEFFLSLTTFQGRSVRGSIFIFTGASVDGKAVQESYFRGRQLRGCFRHHFLPASNSADNVCLSDNKLHPHCCRNEVAAAKQIQWADLAARS